MIWNKLDRSVFWNQISLSYLFIGIKKKNCILQSYFRILHYFHCMKKIASLSFLFLLFLTACSLNATQEASLNNAKVSFINAKNNGSVMSYVAFTLPEAVAYYKDQGDSVFQKRFDLSGTNYNSFIQDGNIREIRQEEGEIQVKFEFLEVNMDEVSKETLTLYALSKNEGVSWFFLEKEDYFNDDIFPSDKRLIDVE